MAVRSADHGPAGAPDDVPLDQDWPDIDAANHRFRADYHILQHVGHKVAAQVPDYQEGPGGSEAVTGTTSLGAAWGGWEAAAPLQAAAEEAMRHMVEVYQRLVKEYETAGELLIQTAQNYADIDLDHHQVSAVPDHPSQASGSW